MTQTSGVRRRILEGLELVLSGESMASITLEEARKITSEAVGWKGTTYDLVGRNSKKGLTGDCSGTTWAIYCAAGYKYDYKSTESFPVYAIQSKLFRLLGDDEPKQDGDILLWDHHMAIYSTFSTPLEVGYRTTQRFNKNNKPWTQVNDMWTASHPDTPSRRSVPYGPAAIKYWFPDDPADVYRYVKP